MNTMDRRLRILVAYASKSGTTVEVAEAIGQALESDFTRVEVRPVEEVADIDWYDAAVIGSAVRVGKWLPVAVQFVAQHQEQLRRIPVAYFTVCLTMQEDTPENRQVVEGYMQPVYELVRPIAIGLFAGRMEPDKLGLVERLAVKVIKPPQGDFRDWEEIRHWAADLQPALAAGAALVRA